MRYRVGDYIDPQPHDPWFTSEREAIEVAQKLNERDENEAIAVWNDRDDVCWLVLRGVTFRPD